MRFCACVFVSLSTFNYIFLGVLVLFYIFGFLFIILLYSILINVYHLIFVLYCTKYL